LNIDLTANLSDKDTQNVAQFKVTFLKLGAEGFQPPVTNTAPYFLAEVLDVYEITVDRQDEDGRQATH